MADKDTVRCTSRNKGEKAGRTAAETCVPTASMRGTMAANNILAALRDIKESHRRAAAIAARATKAVPAEIEWLLDNWYLAEREGKDAALQFRAAERLRRHGRDCYLVALAKILVKTDEGRISPESLSAFFDGVQEIRALDEREISLIIPAIFAALVFRLRDLAAQIDRPGAGRDDDKTAQQFAEIFSSLRLLATVDITDTLENISLTERTLARDPAGVYVAMDERTRGQYRKEVSRLAKRHGIEEFEVARRVLELSAKGQGGERHVGYYLFTRPLGEARPTRRGGWYISGIIGLSVFFSVLAAVVLYNPFVALLLILPISEILKNLFDFFVMKWLPPQHIPRLALEDGVPPQGRTLCVISALINSTESVRGLTARLEEYYLANRDSGDQLIFGILADFPESDQQLLPEMDDWLHAAESELAGLNKKYGESFLLLYRPRKWNKANGRYMGWERKRGAILELTRLLTGKQNSLQLIGGSKLLLNGVRYVITLDSDTRLNVGAAREMIGAMLHPLNTPIVDKKRGIVREGTALLQPRIGVDLSAASRSDFTRIFAGLGGIDPYGSATSDVYQDIFAEGSFTGKGIFEVASFSACLDKAFPENRILSHDLLEGSYLRAAYLGDVELTDGYPYKTLSYFSRMHRWVRGDWQNAPWLLRTVTTARGKRVKNPLGRVSRWKIFDNLRRSLVPISTMAALLLAVFLCTQSLLWAAAVAVLSPLSALLISSAELMFRREPGVRARYHSGVFSGIARRGLETMSQIILLPYHAWIALSGIVTALWRMCVTRRDLLSWVTAADEEKKSRDGLGHYYAKMFPAVLIALAVIFFAGIVPAVAVGLVWLTSPFYAYTLSRERRTQKRVTEEQRRYLLDAAADIWRYFETFLTPEDHFLPPDNWQEQPAAGIAHRTSPTNIGLALLSALAAIDLGLCPKMRALGFIENMLATMERMEKWNGHLYNWYDTRSLRPLHPIYVSAVDSGNLSGCLITLREGLYELGETRLGLRADKLFQDMAFDELYDKRRKLFHIGRDLDKDELTEGWYDLLASEARQTSYIAIARGDVEPRHWRRLGRALVSQDNYSGMASWTGTMFEDLLSERTLFLFFGLIDSLFLSLSFQCFLMFERYFSVVAPVNSFISRCKLSSPAEVT